MITTTATPPAEQRITGPVGAKRVLAIELRDDPDGVMRVLTTLRRRRCRVTRIEFSAPDRHCPGLLVVGIVAPAARAHCVDAWIERLVEVQAVESLG